MDFIGYRSDALGIAVDLVNALHADQPPELPSVLAVHRYLLDVPWGPAPEQDLWRWAGRLAEVFRTTEIADAARLVNSLLADADLTPHLTTHTGQSWHLHYSRPDAGVVDRIRATTAFALATLISEYGLERHGVCSAAGCQRVYADTSRNASRRYCSSACANRSAVAAHRARRRSAGLSAAEPTIRPAGARTRLS